MIKSKYEIAELVKVTMGENNFEKMANASLLPTKERYQVLGNVEEYKEKLAKKIEGETGTIRDCVAHSNKLASKERGLDKIIQVISPSRGNEILVELGIITKEGNYTYLGENFHLVSDFTSHQERSKHHEAVNLIYDVKKFGKFLYEVDKLLKW